MNDAIYIVKCPACGTGNRIPVDKEGHRGHCGSCRASLPPLYCHPLQMTDLTFDPFISTYSGPVLAEFWSPVCPHCHTFAPVVRTLAEKLAGLAAILKINTQDSPVLAARFGIRGIPAIVLMKQGRVIDQITGAQPLDAVMSWFRQKA